MKKFRLAAANHGCSCDICGAEIFDYPQNRICDACEKTLSRAEKTVCEKCGRKVYTQGVCLNCKSELPQFTRGFAPFVYRAQVASLINRFKNGEADLGWFFGEELAEYFLSKNGENIGEESVLLVPVPVTKRARLKRGYNQAERLIESIENRFLQKGMKAESNFHILLKKRETASQKHMKEQERRKNVEDAYRAVDRKACKDRIVLLVDDIMTTGATASECASRLKRAGAKEVYFLSVAALPERRD